MNLRSRMAWPLRTGLLCFVLACTLGGASVRAQSGMEPVGQAICRTIEASAHANRLPVAFLTRIIWRESSFRAGVVSPAGAQGIAQFMPETAQARGLADPFDPEQAIPKAARLLADLERRFGNLGLAAAAYNAGANRVSGWLQNGGALPAETHAYVRAVTGRAAEEWSQSGSTGPTTETATEQPQPASCLTVLADLRKGRGLAPGIEHIEPLAPWGVQLAGNFSKPMALAAFDRARQRYAAVIGGRRPMIIGRLLRSRGTRTFYEVRLPAETRAQADALCGRIQSVGGACVAMRS
jgi:Transglycosylase SLT domain/SPOR domain